MIVFEGFGDDVKEPTTCQTFLKMERKLDLNKVFVHG
jgi:hypothetical protein